MTCFSPRLRLAPGSLRRSDTRLDGPPAASGRRLRGAPGAQQRGLRGAPAFAADTGRTLRPPASLCLNAPPPNDSPRLLRRVGETPPPGAHVRHPRAGGLLAERLRSGPGAMGRADRLP